MKSKSPTDREVIFLAEQLTGLTGLAAVHKVSFDQTKWLFWYGATQPKNPPYDGKVPRQYWPVIRRLDNEYLDTRQRQRSTV